MSTATTPLYETDFYGWIQQQAASLRAGKLAELDVANLIEEIESMGKSEKRELEARLEVLLMHLLKWRYQPERRSTRRELTIEEQRRRLADHLAENPSLKSKIPEVHDNAYRYAIFSAAQETKMHRSVFPTLCPWTFEQATDPNFWPEA